ncbi:hypothetical protein [Paenibacillus marinisediminis]
MYTPIPIPAITAKIKELSGLEFERFAHAVLGWSNPLEYRRTRQIQDYAIVGLGIHKHYSQTVYSAYGSESSTHWIDAKNTLDAEVKGLRAYFTRNQVQLENWIVLLNQELSEDEYEWIQRVGMENEISSVQVMTPVELGQLIVQSALSYPVGRLFGLLPLDRPQDELQPYTVAKNILLKLPQLRDEPVEHRKEQLFQMIGEIIAIASATPEDFTDNELTPIQRFISYTRISDPHIKLYVYANGEFMESQEDHRKSYSILEAGEQGEIIFKVVDLYGIYRILNILTRDVEKYQIQDAFEELMGISYFSLTRLTRI